MYTFSADNKTTQALHVSPQMKQVMHITEDIQRTGGTTAILKITFFKRKENTLDD